MTIEKLMKYCLQYLEQDSDTDIVRSEIGELLNDDVFSNYIKNMEHAIYMALTRYASSNVLEIQKKKFEKGSNSILLKDNTNVPVRNADRTLSYGLDGKIIYKTNKKKLFHKIKEVYAEDSNGNLLPNVDYYVIGSEVKIKNFNKNFDYFVVYHPTVYEFDYYIPVSETDIYNIELEDLGCSDEMAANIKYLVYSELKTEENANLANVNRNYFESYLSNLETIQTYHNQTDMVSNGVIDVEAAGNGYSREWRDIYGD